LKTPVTQSEEEGRRFKAELRHQGFNGRLLRVLHGARKRERGGVMAMTRQRAGGATLDRLGEGGREDRERGHAAWWASLPCWVGLVRSARWPLGRGKEKGK
jgi:hypothetical protein